MKKLEAQEQENLITWCNLQSGKYPELNLIFHIPNGGSRNKIEAFNLKKQGVKAGVPDLFLPVAKKGYYGLFIEMKVKNNKPTENQKKWLSKFTEQGYLTKVCYSFEEAQKTIINYLGKENDNMGFI